MKTVQFRNFRAALVFGTLFSSALACNTVKSANLRRKWRKLQPSVTLADRFSD